MKKLLLASSALVAMSGAAFAQDITLSADLGVEYGNWDVAPGGAADSFSYTAEMTAALEGTSGDLTYGGEITFDAVASSVDFGEIWVSGAWGRLGFDADGYDELEGAGGDEGDIKYTGSFSGVDATVVLDADMNSSYYVMLAYAGSNFNVSVEDMVDSDSDVTTVAGDVTFGNFTVGAEASDDSSWEAFASTSFNGVNAKLTVDSADVITANLDGTAGALDWAVELDSNSEYAASVETSFGDTSVAVSVDSDADYGGTDYDSSDAQALIEVTHTVGNFEFFAMANDNSDRALGFNTTFDF